MDPKQFPSKMFRDAEGRMRVDSGDTSVITDPRKRETIILDHIKKEVQRIPMPQPPQLPEMPKFTPPGMPGGAPPAPPSNVIDLGKNFIEGHAVEGKKYLFQPPAPPNLPQAPDMPQAPRPEGVISALEVWTSSQLHLPVLTKTIGSFGEQICHCRCAGMEPPPNTFDIPPDYKPAGLAGKAKLPGLPR
ncbi:MAG: hypothetical protein IT166_06770 [Bryobacterales bacterium]|nr:hypothetical protein [Bryobacterales bacterium]